MMYSFSTKRIGAVVLSISIVFSSVSLGVTLSPEKAHAQFVTAAFEVNPAIIAGVALTAANTTVDSLGVAPKNFLDALAWTLAKMTVQSLTRSVVNWINSGFSGSPAFVSDLRENLSSLGDAIADDFFQHLDQTVIGATGFSIRSPFQDQLNQKLREEFYRTTSSYGVNEFYDLYKTTKDPKAFINGDFNQGGFDAYFSATQNPANNPFGAYKLASNQLFAQIDASAQQRKAELGWGRGFLPWRGSCNNGGNSQAVSLSKNEKCLFNSVKTPGAVIETSLGITATSPIRQLELADSINEIVAALMGQLINQVLGGSGLSGASQPSAGGGPSVLDQATDPAQYDGVTSSISAGVAQNIQKDITNATAYRDNWQKILTAANAAQGRCGLRPEVSEVIVTATENVSRGEVALIKIKKIQDQVTGATKSTGVDKTTQITAAVTSYQSYLADPSVPNTLEQTEAKTQASDTSADSKAPQSLYTKMVNFQKNCSAT